MSSAGYTFFKWAAVRRSNVKRLRELETEGQERMAGPSRWTTKEVLSREARTPFATRHVLDVLGSLSVSRTLYEINSTLHEWQQPSD